MELEFKVGVGDSDSDLPLELAGQRPAFRSARLVLAEACSGSLMPFHSVLRETPVRSARRQMPFVRFTRSVAYLVFACFMASFRVNLSHDMSQKDGNKFTHFRVGSQHFFELWKIFLYDCVKSEENFHKRRLLLGLV